MEEKEKEEEKAQGQPAFKWGTCRLGQAGLFEEEAKKASLATSAALNKGQGEPKKNLEQKIFTKKNL